MSYTDIESTVEKMINGNITDVLLDLTSANAGIALSSFLIIGLFGSIGIYSGTWAVPAVFAIFMIPIVITVIQPTVAQILIQAVIVVIVALLYSAFR